MVVGCDPQSEGAHETPRVHDASWLRGRSRRALFAELHEAELIWTGKTYEVTNVLLPFVLPAHKLTC